MKNLFNSNSLLGAKINEKGEIEASVYYLVTDYIDILSYVEFEEFKKSLSPVGLSFCLYNSKKEYIKDSYTTNDFPKYRKKTRHIRVSKLSTGQI